MRWGRGVVPAKPVVPRILAVVLCLGLAGCAGQRAPEGEVVLYTSIPLPVVDLLEGVVERRFPDLEGTYWLAPMGGEGISLTVVRGRTADIEERIAREIEDGGIRADIIWLAEPSPYEAYKDMGLLARYDPPSDAPIPAAYIDPDGFYVGGRVIGMVVAWNTDLVAGGLSDWGDLAVLPGTAFPDPESGASRATIAALLDLYGRSYFEDLAGSGAAGVSSNSAVIAGLERGEFPAGAVLDYMARQAEAGGAPVEYAFPTSGTVLIPSPIAITAEARNPEAAETVVDFFLSRPGQQILVEIGNFYPVRLDVSAPPGARPLRTIPALEVDWRAMADDLESIESMWLDLFGD